MTGWTIADSFQAQQVTPLWITEQAGRTISRTRPGRKFLSARVIWEQKKGKTISLFFG